MTGATTGYDAADIFVIDDHPRRPPTRWIRDRGFANGSRVW